MKRDRGRFWMGIDQYGRYYMIGRRPPRKTLMEMVGVRGARKMYWGRVRGGEMRSVHTGWIVGRYWIEVYELVGMDEVGGKE